MVDSVSSASQTSFVPVEAPEQPTTSEYVVIDMPADFDPIDLLGPQAPLSLEEKNVCIDILQTLETFEQQISVSAEDAQAVQSFVADGVVSQSSVFTHQQGQSLETVPQRIGAVAHYLQTQLRETLDTLPRPLSNLAVSTAFNLPSVCALTMARSALSAAVAEGVSGSAAVITGAACSALPLLLTLAAAGHHLYNGTATPAYLASQGAFLAVSALILGAALATGPATIFAGLAGSAPAVALYCLSRDLLQPFHGLGSNTGLSLPVNLVDGIAYGALQFAAGAAALWTDSGLVGALINGLIESVEPALNEELSAWMHGRDEAVDEQSFRLNYEVQVPGWRQIVTRLENTGIPRMTAFAIISTGVATAQHIGVMGLNDSQNYWLANGAGALLATYILTPFYQSHALQPGELAEVVVTRL